MAGVSPVELTILAARLVFVAALYLFLVLVLVALGKRLGAMPDPPDRPGTATAHAALLDGSVAQSLPVLTLVEAAPGDVPAGTTVIVDRPLVFGRRPECDVVLRDGAVSGRHARVRGQNGALWIEDLESRNGTFVNGRRISGALAAQPGDTIHIGAAVWRVDRTPT